MSPRSKGIVAGVAISLTLGAAQFASGRDLSSGSQSTLMHSSNADATVIAINRTAKADRTSAAVRAGELTQTILFQPNGLPATSVVVRVPLAQASRNSSSALWIRSEDGKKRAVACEPVVSVLTEIAKQLQPGRCVT